jgi:glycosyltransferase involved in cell wall biosynthesis
MEMIYSSIDPHCHSRHSGLSSEWFLRKMGCPESFSEPGEIYRQAKERGMQLVTITDHNVIAGCLEIAHHPDVVIGCEVACSFPDSGAKVDVITLGITEEQFHECVRLRENLFDLVKYVNNEKIFHILAHPLYRMNSAYDADHFEKCLLLFKNMEVLNGTRTKAQNLSTQRVLDRLDRETIERLAEKHKIEPIGDQPWQKNRTGGSDDHGGLLVGSTYTGVPRVDTFSEFCAAVDSGKSEAVGTISTSHTLAHNIYRAAYKYIVDILGAYEPTKGDPLHYMVMKLLFADESARPKAIDVVRRKVKKKLGKAEPDTSPYQILTLIKNEAKSLARDHPKYQDLFNKPMPQDKDELNRAVYGFLSVLSNRVMARLADDMIQAIEGLSFNKILDIIPGIGTAHFFLLPYYVAYGATNQSNRLIEEVGERYLPPELKVRPHKKVAMFTDTFDEVNGVAVVVKQMAEEARRAGAEMYIVKSGPEESGVDGNVYHFQSVADVKLPEYPEVKLRFPSLLDLLDWCEREDFSSIHAATPGTMGMFALLAAKILHVPFVGTYHTEITDYVRYLTGSESMARVASKFIRWFYERMDVVFAPSETSRRNLANHGVDDSIVHFIPWGVDTELFNLDKRDPAIWSQFGADGKVKLLYAGRISKEKDLDVLSDAFIELCGERDNVMLALAGGGPYREELERKLEGYPAVFLGYLDHERLARFYASADIFVFPSTTDTFGNVILEAQAAGLPVIVSDMGGPKENMIHGKTGLVTRGRDATALKQALRTLLDDPGMRRAMAANARPNVADKSIHASFSKYWQLHK